MTANACRVYKFRLKGNAYAFSAFGLKIQYMMTTPEKQLVNKHKFLSDAFVITENANAIERQEDISVPQMPTLSSHQQQARQQCHFWLTSVWPAIQDSDKQVISFSTTFQQIYQQLLDVVDKGGDSMKSQILSLTQKLLKELENRKSVSEDIIPSVTKFSDGYLPVYQKFQDDYNAAKKIIMGDNKELKDLTAKRSSLEAEAHQLQIDSLLPFSGVTYLAALRQVYNEISSVSDQISKISSDLNSLLIVKGQLSSLQSHSSIIVTLSQPVVDGWQFLADNMAETISGIERISPEEAAEVIKIQLDAAYKDWQIVEKQAKGLGCKFSLLS